MKRLIEWHNRIISKYKALKRWKRAVTVLAAILTFATTYALILPAITVEQRLLLTNFNCIKVEII